MFREQLRSNSEKGFTLLELLIVIVVIGILALLIIPNLSSGPKKARDAQRKTDLRAAQKGLEEYFISTAAYPITSSWATLGSSYLTTGNPPILKSLPQDPTNTGVYVYSYSSTDGASYTLRSCLENTADTGQFTSADSTNCGTNGRAFTLVNNN